MEIQFENKMTYSRDIYNEFARRTMGSSIIILPIIGVVGLASTFFAIFLSDSFEIDPRAFLGIGFLVFLIVWPLLAYRLIPGKRYNQLLVVHGGVWGATTDFSENIHIHATNGADSTFAFGQITKIIESKHLIILMIRRLACILVDKDGFTIGSCADFKNYIREKCPKARCKLK